MIFAREQALARSAVLLTSENQHYAIKLLLIAARKKQTNKGNLLSWSAWGTGLVSSARQVTLLGRVISHQDV